MEAARLRRRRAELDAANRELADSTRALALRLVTAKGFSVRDTALLLSISAARVDQMVREPRRHPAA
jgi:predicted transcriptional regulator